MTPGNIADGTNAGTACDHYHRWPQDIQNMQWLGVGAYRFSIAWPRIFPEGSGRINEAGLDFYERLVDALLEAEIRPFVTLNHWDIPQALQDRGGWVERQTAEAFREYANVVAARLGDRVPHWATHNEPWCIATLGYEEGHHAPGFRNPAAALPVAHHLLLSHGWAVEAIRAHSPRSEVGIVLNLTPGVPATTHPLDLAAAKCFDGHFNRWYLDPLYRGSYPEDAVLDRVRRGHLQSKELPFVRPGDFDAIKRPTDFLGVNYYSRAVLRDDGKGGVEGVPVAPLHELTDMGWEVYPQGLHSLLTRIHREYRPSKIYITENGAAYSDGPDGSGRIEDSRRVEYLRSHLSAVHEAIQDGVPVAGYFAWSYMDNFEWAHGFQKRFGLFWVDYATQERIPKESALWFRDAIESGSIDSILEPETEGKS